MSVSLSKGGTFRAAQGVSWVAQGNGVRVLDEVSRRSEVLSYPEAAVWDMACRGRDGAYISANLRWIVGDERRVSEDEVHACLSRWLQAGLLAPGDAAGGLD